MEEILASIRRIISDENAVAEAGQKPTHAPLREVTAEPPGGPGHQHHAALGRCPAFHGCQ